MAGASQIEISYVMGSPYREFLCNGFRTEKTVSGMCIWIYLFLYIDACGHDGNLRGCSLVLQCYHFYLCWIVKILTGETTATNTPSVDFFDNAFTFSTTVSKVTCCHPDNPPEKVTCGRGASCAGQCSLGASLCPSGKCTDDPRTCDLEFPSKDDVEEESGGSIDTLSPLDLAWCDNPTHQCRVRKHKDCCYSPKCLKWNGRKEACSWLNYLTGNSIRFLEISSLSRFLQIFIINICRTPIFLHICRNICENSS